MVAIGEAMKSVRKQCGLSQKELGETLAVSQSYISQVERGYEVPTPMFIKLFCLLYSIDESNFNFG